MDAAELSCNKDGLSDLPPEQRPKRRKRYAGKNPRRFEDKYKEHAPERYADDVAKITASGKTPAGTHRPIMVDEIMQAIAAKPGETAVDCTLGYGGHSRVLVEALQPGGTLFGLDVDPIEQPRTEQRLRDAGHGPEAFQVRHMNFAGLPKLLGQEKLEGLDIVIADLGVSSMQIDNPERGFTYKADGPLDLRLNPTHGQSAASLLSKITPAKLSATLTENADEPRADLLADAILASQKTKPITRTRQLATVIQTTLETSGYNLSETDITDTQRRAFQALRIAVNDEFGALDSLLRVLPSSLNAGGRAAILTFHSGEDRRVKKAFQNGLRSGIYASVSENVIRASFEERHANPRSTSAKLRWAIRA